MKAPDSILSVSVTVTYAQTGDSSEAEAAKANARILSIGGKVTRE